MLICNDLLSRDPTASYVISFLLLSVYQHSSQSFMSVRNELPRVEMEVICT
jgi:hypothetical protein